MTLPHSGREVLQRMGDLPIEVEPITRAIGLHPGPTGESHPTRIRHAAGGESRSEQRFRWSDSKQR